MASTRDHEQSNPDRYDVIVIGAGINGAAIAREAAVLGLQVLLVDQADIGGGTGAASTRLIHGGLRYLEYGEIGLVYESLHERERLFRCAPHLVTPMEFCLPLFAGGSRSRWQIRAGMALYDLLSFGKSVPRHSMLSKAETLDRIPGIDRAGLIGSATYFDGQVSYPERLVLENVLDAVAQGATVKTYAKVREILVDGRRVRGVRWIDADGHESTAFSDKVINATGPWVDDLVGALRKRRLIGGTRGSHLIVAPFEGAPSIAVYTEAASDRRPFFIVPWNGLYLIGTTDERFEGDPAKVTTSDAEYRYLLEETMRLFPKAGDLADKILYTHAGVRPLPYKPRGAEGAITRRHLIRRNRNASGLYSIVGGKLTTHRALAVDVMKRLRRRFSDVPKGSLTANRPLPGALDLADQADLQQEIAAEFGANQSSHWWRIYGGRAADLLSKSRSTPELRATIQGAPLTRVVELTHAFESEFATSLVDVLQRRCMAGLGAGFGLAVAPEAARMLTELGLWDRARAEAELDTYRAFAKLHRVRPQT